MEDRLSSEVGRLVAAKHQIEFAASRKRAVACVYQRIATRVSELYRALFTSKKEGGRLFVSDYGHSEGKIENLNKL